MATKKKDLSILTLLPLSGILRTKAIKDKKAWCPVCLKKFKENNYIYEPLIWNISFIEYCPVHKMKLLEICTVCGKRQPYLTSTTKPGHCFNCRTFLGDITSTETIVLNENDSLDSSWNN